MSDTAADARYAVFKRTSPPLPSVQPSPFGAVARWTPGLLRRVPRFVEADRIGYLKNWVFHVPQMLTGGDAYEVFAVLAGEAALSQCIVTGASWRFPFMQPGDLQIGLVHTAPAHRKKGIALSMLQAVIAAGGSPRAHWWLTELDNVASRRLAESAGFSLVGEAVRQKKLGLPVFTLAAGR